MSPRLPVVGIVTELFQQAPNARPCDEVFGAPRGGLLGKFARERRADGAWVLVVDGRELSVSLDNLCRNLERDADDDTAIDGFIV